jgi:phosphoesterase RecJ-like protein
VKNTTLKQADQLIRSSRHPLLICHIAPDGDAIGSLIGLGRALERMKLQPTLACADPIPPRFDYVPGAETIVQEINESFDLVITLDCSHLERLGHFSQEPTFNDAPLLNIDHHLTNPSFGDVNLVDPQASSTAEVVLRLLEYMTVPLDAEIATALLVGIVSDTRSFSTSNVTPEVMEAALQLMNAGANLSSITQSSLNRRHTNEIHLWGSALDLVQIKDGIIWTEISQEMRRAVNCLDDGDAGLVNFLISAEDADVAAVFVESEDGHIEVGLRAVPGFDVAQVARQFGGGGHALAAGCGLPGPMETAQANVLAALQASLAQQRYA